MDRYFDRLDKGWRALPVEKQCRYIWYFFLSYLILTITVVLKVWCDTRKTNQALIIRYIENPIVKKKESAISMQDSLLKIIKNKGHERE